MCDTQALVTPNGVWFAKNSDREAHEPQAIVRLDAVQGDKTRQLRTTYLEIPQVPDRHAVILSKPCWIWGAEMGVNEHGLAIGNEALFTRQRSLKPALLGMDLLRLALERAQDCDQAIAVITGLLEQYGQGGPAGFADKSFCYDSSFIIADPRQAWVLETAGRDWVARPIETFDAISNAISSKHNIPRSREGVSGPFDRHDTWLLPYFGASHQRRRLSRQCLQQTAAKNHIGFADFARHLRSHARASEDPLKGSNRDICMHAAGPIRRSQTTGSMICHLTADGPQVLVTGTSAPCLSPFRPVSFEHHHAVLSQGLDQAPLWQQWNPVIANALYDRDYRQALRARIKDSDEIVFANWPTADVSTLETQLADLQREILSWPRRDRIPFWRSSRRIWKPYLQPAQTTANQHV